MEDNIIRFSSHATAEKKTSEPIGEETISLDDEGIPSEKDVPPVGFFDVALELPTGLKTRVIKQCLTAGVFFWGSIVAAICCRESVYLAGILLSGALMYMACNTIFDYILFSF